MLHYETIEQNTLDILIKLNKDISLKDYVLVGGTALALQIGHRKSIDLDFFCYGKYDSMSISEEMSVKHQYKENRFSETMSIGYINGIKVDFIKARNILTSKIKEDDGIRLASINDIAAMKLWAIARSGTRMKDYVDIAYLSKHLSLNQMLEAYCKGYNTDSSMFATKKLLYFDSIQSQETIILLDGNFKWEKIEERLKEMVKNPEKIFEKSPLEQNIKKKNRVFKRFKL